MTSFITACYGIVQSKSHVIMEILAAKLEKNSLAGGENFTLAKNPRQGESDGSAGEKRPSLLLLYICTNSLCMCVPRTQLQAETYRFKEICGVFSKLPACWWLRSGALGEQRQLRPTYRCRQLLCTALSSVSWAMHSSAGGTELSCGDSASSVSMIHSPVKPLQLFALPGYCFPYKARPSVSAGGEVFGQLLAPLAPSTGG